MPDICLRSVSAASCHKCSEEFLAVYMSVNSERHEDGCFRFSAAFQMTLTMQGDACTMKCSMRLKMES